MSKIFKKSLSQDHEIQSNERQEWWCGNEYWKKKSNLDHALLSIFTSLIRASYIRSVSSKPGLSLLYFAPPFSKACEQAHVGAPAASAKSTPSRRIAVLRRSRVWRKGEPARRLRFLVLRQH